MVRVKGQLCPTLLPDKNCLGGSYLLEGVRRNIVITVGEPSKKLNSVSFSRSCIFKKIYFNKNLDGTIKN